MLGTCIVTGCAGFVGSHLCEALISTGCRVVGLDNFVSGKQENMQGFCDHPAFVLLEGDIRDGTTLLAPYIIESPLAFFHMAAVVSVPYSLDHPQETMAVNYEASLALLRLAEGCGARSFVFAGSAAEYGAMQCFPLSEDDATDSTIQLSPYGRSKYLTSRAVAASPIGCSLRCFNIYGPRQDSSSLYSGVVSLFTDHALAGHPITVHGDGGQTRDFIYIEDVVAAYLLAGGILGNEPFLGTYNLGSGLSLSVLELAQMLIRLSKSSSRIIHSEARAGDIRHSIADISRLQAKKFSPRISLEMGLNRLIATYER